MQDFRYVGLDISLKQRALGDIHFCFLSQLAYNSEILSNFVSAIRTRTCERITFLQVGGVVTIINVYANHNLTESTPAIQHYFYKTKPCNIIIADTSSFDKVKNPIYMPYQLSSSAPWIDVTRHKNKLQEQQNTLGS